MPCFEIRLQDVEFHADNQELLEQAVKARNGYVTSRGKVFSGYLPATGRFQIVNGKMQVPVGTESEVDALKVAYSNEIVKKAASRFGWALKQSGNNAYVASRR